MSRQLGLDTVKRVLTLKTHHIYSLPVAILMPHSSCNCRCVMCDIWKGNANARLLDEDDVGRLLDSLRRLGTRWVVLSGGEALLNPRLFELCRLLRTAGLKITILSTGLLLRRYAQQVVTGVDEVIVSLDGPPDTHDRIRRVPNAFTRLSEGVQALKALNPHFRVTGRCVIQRLNFTDWPEIVAAAHTIGLDQISFLAADVSSEAFNRPELWGEERREEVRLEPGELPALAAALERLKRDYAADLASGFIAESPAKLERIVAYYRALVGQCDFPPVRCNAPWVSAVVEADGAVRPCFFHPTIGNIRQDELGAIINQPEAVAFRRSLDMDSDPICRKCVCSLNLRPLTRAEPGG
jgi:MoaA/NifB/PqqE/SkfB family radical SAM enzyme